MKNTLAILFIILFSSKINAVGCNFGFTNTVIVGSTHSYTIGQGPWGIRKYTWNFGDGSQNVISYSNQNNITFATHTFSTNGNYTLNITACDSLSGAGCISFGNFAISVMGVVNTGLYQNNTINALILYPEIFSESFEIKNGYFNKIEVINSSGEIIISENFATTNYYKLHLFAIPIGIYYVSIYNETKRIKIVKTVRIN